MDEAECGEGLSPDGVSPDYGASRLHPGYALASTTVLGAEHLIYGRLAIGAQVRSTASVLAKKIFADLIGCRARFRFAVKLLGDCVTHEGGNRGAAAIQMCSQGSLKLCR